MQLVLSNNRIIAHGENFIALGGVVINTETGAKYENSTIAECECAPSDIGQVGYEYHAGAFVPCAPFGIGTGNIAVYCDDCKTPRDSGIHIDDISKRYTLLWENASPDSDFNGHTATLLSDDYDFLFVIARAWKSEAFSFSSMVEKKSRLFNMEKDSSSTAIEYLTYREIEADGTSITFGNGYRRALDTSKSSGKNNGAIIPVKIYGVRI